MIGVLIATGCSGPVSKWKFSNMFDLDKGMPWEEDESEVPEGTPVRVDGTWIDTVRYQEGQVPQRGFGGKLIFYEKDSSEPIKVEGELVVYAFDETNRDPTDNRPTRRYVFPAEQFALHMSVGDNGPSYSFFLPWDNAPGPQTEVSLICRFVPAKGAVCVSEQTRHLLPGPQLPELAALNAAPRSSNAPTPTIPASQPKYQQLIYESQGGPKHDAVQQMSFESTASERTAAGLTTTSIALPSNFRLPSGASGSRRIGGDVETASRHEPAALRAPSAAPIPPAASSAPAGAQHGTTAATPNAASLAMPSRPQFVPIGRAQLGSPVVSTFASAYPTLGTQAIGQPTVAAQPQAGIQPTQNTAQPGGTMPQVSARPQQFSMPQMGPQSPTAPIPQQHGFPQPGAISPSQQVPQQPASPQQMLAPQSSGASTGPSLMQTTVSYLSPQDSLRWEQRQRSSGSPPSARQAPWRPAAR